MWFVFVLLLLFVVLHIWGEHLQSKQDAKDEKEIADLECPTDTKVRLYAALLREQADRDL